VGRAAGGQDSGAPPQAEATSRRPRVQELIKITRLETFLVKPRWLFLKVHTNAGIVGLGEPITEGRALTCAAAVRELEPYLVGKDPRAVAHHWQAIYRHAFYRGGPILTSALSGIDQALWDIKGKALGVPVSTLLGGAYRTRARAYATGLYEPQGVPSIPTALVEEATGYAKAGFCGMKLKVGYDLRTDLTYIRAIREAIGPELLLMVDANHAYNASEAIRLARAMEPYDIHWFEEPVPPEDLDGYLEIKRKSTILIAGGECEYTRYGFRELINRRAVDILQPDLCAMGGFSEMLKVIAMAGAANLPVIPHVWGTNVGLAAALQMFAALPHFPERRFPAEPLFEYDRSPHPFRDGVTHEQFAMRDGHLPIPDRPGLGVTLDLDFVRRFAG
jgi:D-galactarolactone cycloisomerase